jgi:putative membrane protein
MIAIIAFISVETLIFFELTPYSIDRSIPLIIGTAIAIFLGFRTNSAYERWWEARKIWGRIINDSLSIGRLMRDFVGDSNPDSKALIERFCLRQAAWAYSFDRQLKGQGISPEVETLLTKEEFEGLKSSPDPALTLLLEQGNEIHSALKNGQIDTYQSIALQELLSNLTTHFGGCNRIKGTKFPTHYSYFTEVFIWIFLLLLGLSLPSHGGTDALKVFTSGYIAIPAIILIGWVFFMVEGIARYMQTPFENNRNVIPMHALSRKIEIGLRMTIGETDGLPKQIEPVDGALM